MIPSHCFSLLKKKSINLEYHWEKKIKIKNGFATKEKKKKKKSDIDLNKRK